MPVVRSVTEAEVDRAGEIGAIAFGGGLEDWQKAFHQFVGHFGLESMLVVEHEGRLVSSMLLVGESMLLGHHTVPARAVAAVGTIPDARCLGCAGAMMQEATRRMKAWGIAASPMWPFSFAYYRKFGWEIGGESRVVTWPRDVAFQIEPRGGIMPVTSDDVDALASVWDATSPRHRCATVRVPEHWKRLLRPESYGGDGPKMGGLLCRQGGEAAGYALFQAPETPEGEEPKPVSVNEMRALNPAAEVALIGALARRLPEAVKFTAAFSPENRLRSVAVNPRDLNTEMHASFGFRVIDPALTFASFTTERALTPVRLRVEDELLGTKTWEVCLDGGPATYGETDTAPDLTATIQTFSQIVSGYLKPASAAAAGLLQGDASAVERLQEATATWTVPFRSGLEEG